MFRRRPEVPAEGGVNEAAILNALRQVMDPDLHRDIVSLGFVKNLKVQDGHVQFDIELTTPACPVRHRMEQQAKEVVSALPGVKSVEVRMTAQVRSRPVAHQEVLPGVRNTIAVASGKGGVGKSTVAVNLALALAQSGAQVGILDADVYGPSIPIMLGVKGQRPFATPENKIAPIERFGVRMMSIGFLTDERAPVIWRGPMVGKLLQEFLMNVDWGELDYLVVDLPPGTGDAQLTLSQSAPLSGAIVVTTPQEVALEDVVRALRMFHRVEVPVLGIVENMSYFVCPHCGERSAIFRSGGGRRAAQQLQVAFLGEIPIDPRVCESGDEGEPIVLRYPDSSVAQAFHELAGQVAASLSTLSFQGKLQFTHDPNLPLVV